MARTRLITQKIRPTMHRFSHIRPMSSFHRPTLLTSRILRHRFQGRIAFRRPFCDFLNDAPYTLKDKIYDVIHRSVVSVIVACCIFTFLCIGFLTVKIHKQHSRVRDQMKQVKFFRDVMRACPDIFEDLDTETMDVTPIYGYFVAMADEDGKVQMDKLMEDEFVQVMIDSSVPLRKIIDWGDMGYVRLEALVYMFTIVKYFSLFEKQDETKKLKRQIGDKMYKMMKSYSKVDPNQDGTVRGQNLLRWSESGFGLGILSAPDLGHMTLDEYMPLFVRGMIDDEELKMEEYVSRRSFDLLHKACDYHIGIRRIKRKGNKQIRG